MTSEPVLLSWSGGKDGPIFREVIPLERGVQETRLERFRYQDLEAAARKEP